MSIQHPHKTQVKFCPHHKRVGTTEQIADFLYSTVVPLADVGIEVVKAMLGCGCTVWLRPIANREIEARMARKMGMLNPPRPTPSGQPPVADSTKGKARKVDVAAAFARRQRRLEGM